MIEAKRAPVRPRVVSVGGCAATTSNHPLLLEDEIRSFVEAGAHGKIMVAGLPGSGKTTALAHLAALLPPDCRVSLLDEPKPEQLAETPDCLIVATVSMVPDRQLHLLLRDDYLAMYVLASWNRDDVIEYLLAVHRPRCAAVMARVHGDHLLLGGLPALMRIALDRLASDDSLPDVRRALHRHLEEHLTDTDLLERARSACLNRVVTPGVPLADAVIGLARPGFADGLIQMLRHKAMQMLLASERIAADLHGEADCDYLAKRLPRELVEAAGRLVGEDERALEHLHALLAGPSWSHAMAASILHAAGQSVHLRERCPRQLAGAYLDGVSWPRVNLEGANLFEASLTGADLSSAELMHTALNKSNLGQARLSGACLDGAVAAEADLHDADLRHVRAEGAKFVAANLRGADFASAHLPRVTFADSDLTGAVFRGANLVNAIFARAVLTAADFSEANLTGAVLSGLRLGEAHWEGARFAHALLEACDLEYLTFAAPDFEEAELRGALLTGSTMFGGNFRGACLREAGLADIEWEGADLRGADLRGASFHMGSTRSGLVGSTIPCEGSKTGFYTDDYDEQTYKAPEEIRKANLCGADLRGAVLDGVDFYLVDLRGARYDAEQETHLRRCGAILETRV
jgi:uncharacterized protein YjbI with pentapeptide repeats